MRGNGIVGWVRGKYSLGDKLIGDRGMSWSKGPGWTSERSVERKEWETRECALGCEACGWIFQLIEGVTSCMADHSRELQMGSSGGLAKPCSFQLQLAQASLSMSPVDSQPMQARYASTYEQDY